MSLHLWQHLGLRKIKAWALEGGRDLMTLSALSSHISSEKEARKTGKGLLVPSRSAVLSEEGVLIFSHS
jgi:hypothetical protein